MISSNFKRACLADCTEAQQEAISHIDGPLLVLAGPGSGKTRVITRRIGYLAASGVSPQRILAITFTNKAAEEMSGRVEAMGGAMGAWVSTFHSFCARMMRLYAPHVGRTHSFTIYDAADSLAAVKRAIGSLHFDEAEFKPARVARLISTAKNRLDSPEVMAAYPQPDAAAVSQIYAQYERMLESSNAVDFDDLLGLTVRLLAQEPEVAAKLRGRFDYILIDEYQDTNRAQYLLAKYLAAEHKNLCATGDPDQSIYGWRGADIGNILAFERDYPEAKVVRLEQNYRSTKMILRAAAGLIACNDARKKKDLWTENAEGERMSILRAQDEEEEGHLIVEDIARRTHEQGIALKDVAVFYRVNAQSRVLETALRSEALAYRIVSGTEFFQRAEVKDLLAYLRLVVNPGDDVSALRVVNVPVRKVGGVSLGRMRVWADSKGAPLLQAFARPVEAGVRGAALKGCANFLSTLKTLQAMPQRPVAAIVDKLVQATDFEKHLKSLDKGEERILNARELVNAGAEYDRAEPEGDLLGFLERVALISDTDRWDGAQGGVTLMTLHAAKGLEFPLVYVVGLEEGLLPLTRMDGECDLEEERRLLFVGITRAKSKVTLSFAESRLQYGKRDYPEISRFLKNLPDEAIEGMPEMAAPAHWRTKRLGSARHDRKGGAQFRTERRSETEEIVYDGDTPFVDDDAPFQPGDLVRHESFGRGKVLELSGYGENLHAKVKFHLVGVKRLSLKYAPIKKV